MKKPLNQFIWLAVAVLGAWAYVTLALHRGEQISSAYILTAALCSYAIGFRFYSKWVAARILALNDRRATPCEVREDGKDFVKTNKWIVFGHHFAAISGPGPLVGPVLAAQFGYLPGTLWILIGVVLGGAVQDFVILFCSMRRNGKSLGQMVKEELNTTAGVIGVAAILAIMIILLAVLALVVVKALAESPWGVFTVGATIPIAMLMGGYLRFWRVGKVMEVSAIGVVLLLLAVWGGQFVHSHATLGKAFTLRDITLAWAIILYGLAASVLPVWLLLAPRDYLSTFMKLGTIFALAFGVFLVLPNLKMPAISQFIDGSGLVVAGKLFPFCFITIACGAISGFHTLISSGVTPKIITRESYARPIGYGAMCLESLVAIMAMIAACTLEPGVYLSMNVKGAGADAAAIAADTVAKVTATGFSVTTEQMDTLATQIGEKTLFGRTGGAATLAVGMANIFSGVTGGRWLDLWYHFAIMFEALFILTTLDAGTRVGRYLLQDVLGNVWKPLGDTKRVSANVLASVLVVAGWGYFLIQGVRDPLGGINSLWPLFGIANQLLASIALCLATTVILKMQLTQSAGQASGLPAGAASRRSNDEAGMPRQPADRMSALHSQPGAGRPAYALVTLLPLVWLLSVTMTAGVQKIFHADPRIGFLSQAKSLNEKLPALEQALRSAEAGGDTKIIADARKAVATNRTLHFNNVLDAAVAGIFLTLVVMIVVLSAREWLLLIARRRLAVLREAEPVWLPDYVLAEGKPLRLFGLFALAFALARELSGEAALDRAQNAAQACDCSGNSPACEPFNVQRSKSDAERLGCAVGTSNIEHRTSNVEPSASRLDRGKLFAGCLERRFKGINRCC
ncbi:MAG: carbon starvation protein A [Verrucomicrobia bacterium]|nr:carbon starvation protein A [Verrucomicrobiota bacterium]